MPQVRKLTKVAQSSYAVVIPMKIVKKLGWQEKQPLVIRRSGKKVIVENEQTDIE